MPGGGLSPDGVRWIACSPGFFLPLRILCQLFLDRLSALHGEGGFGWRSACRRRTWPRRSNCRHRPTPTMSGQGVPFACRGEPLSLARDITFDFILYGDPRHRPLEAAERVYNAMLELDAQPDRPARG